MRRGAPRSPLQRLLIMSGALLALVGGYYWGNQHKREYQPDAGALPHNLSATLLRQARPLQDFELTGHTGARITPIDLMDRWSLLFFGCSRCTGTLGVLTRLIQVRNRLAARPLLQNSTQLVLVTVEPDLDSPPQLDALLRDFGPGFVGLTGPGPQIKDLAGQLGMPEPGRGSEHPALFLISPGGIPVAVFPSGLAASAIAADFTQIVDYYER